MNYLSSIRWFTNQPPVTPVTNITLPAVYISHYTPSYQPPVQQHQSVRFADVPGSERPGRSAGMAHGPVFFWFDRFDSSVLLQKDFCWPSFSWLTDFCWPSFSWFYQFYPIFGERSSLASKQKLMFVDNNHHIPESHSLPMSQGWLTRS